MKMAFFIICMILALIFLVKRIIQIKQDAKLRREIKDMQVFAQQADELIKGVESFIPSIAGPYSLSSSYIDGFLYIDNESRRLCLVKRNLTHKIFEGNDILYVSITEDDSIITETKNSNQIGNAIVDDALSETASTELKKTTVRTKNSAYVDNLRIVIHINDPDNYTLILNCLTSRASRNSQTYQSALSAARQWQGIFDVLMCSTNESYDKDCVGQ